MAKTILLLLSLYAAGVTSHAVEKRLVSATTCPDTERLYHARVVFESSDGKRITCGGTLIHTYWVITASHCYGGNGGALKVELGSHPTMAVRKQLDISRGNIKIYAKTALEEPIMLLKLPESVSKITPAVLPPGACMAPSDAEELQVSGRGATTAEKGMGVKDLMCLKVKTLSKDHCPDLSGTSYEKHTYIYCGEGINGAEIKACKGDSGSGLLRKEIIKKSVFKRKKKVDVLYGVLISGHDECEDKFIFVDLCAKPIKKWIDSHVS